MRFAKLMLMVLVTAVLGTGIACADLIEGSVLVVDNDSSFAFVGWYGADKFPTSNGQAWTIFLNTVRWAIGEGNDILLFTADGTSNPDNAGNLEPGIIYNRLNAEGFSVDVANQADIVTLTDYSNWDLVIYPNLDDNSAVNMVGAQVAFITMQPGQTDEINIGTGVAVLSGDAQFFQVVDNAHPATSDLSLGSLGFDNPVPTQSIQASGNGHVLIGNEVVPEPATLLLMGSGVLGLLARRKRS